VSSGPGGTVTVALLFPDLLGTYGDSGNAVILARRLAWRGFDARMVTIRSGDPVPESCELYVVGGGEDLPQTLAARELGPVAGGPLRRAVDRGAAVLAVCAGLQIIGTSFVGPDGVETGGLALVDCSTRRGTGPRAVGEIMVEPDPDLGLPTLSGYENHAGVTIVGSGSLPLGRVRHGVGNGDGSGTDGVRSGRVLGTYLHGPVLARNPALADHLLASVVGELAPLDDSESEDLRRERLAASNGPELGRRGLKLLQRIRR
jgi:lipid II isoglutaminyl synthase (glutamine-hydrolysing)